MEYLYILSNPSMPGLVKVGRTTTSPSQRMSELHSTGVPTPFCLECSFAVSDSGAAEREAHRVLAKFRVSESREFFKLSPKKAIAAVIEAVDYIEVVDFNETHDIPSLQRVSSERAQQAAERQREEDERRQREARAKEAALQRERNSLSAQLSGLESQYRVLGPKPPSPRYELHPLFAMAFFPLPFGVFFWVGAIGAFSKNNDGLGWALALLIFLGWISWSEQRSKGRRYAESTASHNTIESEIYEVKRKLSALSPNGESVRSILSPASSTTGAGPSQTKSPADQSEARASRVSPGNRSLSSIGSNDSGGYRYIKEHPFRVPNASRSFKPSAQPQVSSSAPIEYVNIHGEPFTGWGRITNLSEPSMPAEVGQAAYIPSFRQKRPLVLEAFRQDDISDPERAKRFIERSRAARKR